MTSQVISRSILFGELIRSKTAICGMIILADSYHNDIVCCIGDSIGIF